MYVDVNKPYVYIMEIQALNWDMNIFFECMTEYSDPAVLYNARSVHLLSNY